MKPRRPVRTFNLEVKQLMCAIGRIIRHLVRRRMRNRGTHRPVVVDEAGPTGDKKLAVIPIDECVQDISPVTPQVVYLRSTAEHKQFPLGDDRDDRM